MLRDAATPLPRRSFGRYQLLFRIASGGMAEVYAARAIGEAGFEKLVAVKRMLPPHADDEEFISMFLDEARVTAYINSPHCVQTFDLGRADDGSLYIVMELVVGVTLGHVLKWSVISQRPLPIGLVLDVIAQAAQGLDDAHEAKSPDGRALEIVHRDVSPQNILLGVDGRTRLTDFGVAHTVVRQTASSADHFKGKLAYCAPEQLQGERPDRRSDIFALGVVVWELLAGRHLFLGENPLETLQRVKSRRIRPVSELRPEVPEAISDVVMRALVRSRVERTETARRFRRDLLAAGAETHPPPTREQLSEVIRLAGGEELVRFQDQLRNLHEPLRSESTGETITFFLAPDGTHNAVRTQHMMSEVRETMHAQTLLHRVHLREVETPARAPAPPLPARVTAPAGPSRRTARPPSPPPPVRIPLPPAPTLQPPGPPRPAPPPAPAPRPLPAPQPPIALQGPIKPYPRMTPRRAPDPQPLPMAGPPRAESPMSRAPSGPAARSHPPPARRVLFTPGTAYSHASRSRPSRTPTPLRRLSLGRGWPLHVGAGLAAMATGIVATYFISAPAADPPPAVERGGTTFPQPVHHPSGPRRPAADPAPAPLAAPSLPAERASPPTAPPVPAAHAQQHEPMAPTMPAAQAQPQSPPVPPAALPTPGQATPPASHEPVVQPELPRAAYTPSQRPARLDDADTRTPATARRRRFFRFPRSRPAPAPTARTPAPKPKPPPRRPAEGLLGIDAFDNQLPQ